MLPFAHKHHPSIERFYWIVLRRPNDAPRFPVKLRLTRGILTDTLDCVRRVRLLEVNRLVRSKLALWYAAGCFNLVATISDPGAGRGLARGCDTCEAEQAEEQQCTQEARCADGREAAEAEKQRCYRPRALCMSLQSTGPGFREAPCHHRDCGSMRRPRESSPAWPVRLPERSWPAALRV